MNNNNFRADLGRGFMVSAFGAFAFFFAWGWTSRNQAQLEYGVYFGVVTWAILLVLAYLLYNAGRSNGIEEQP